MRGVNRFADRRIWPKKNAKIVDFSDTLSGFADLENTADHGLAENFGPDSRLFMSESVDHGY